MTNLNDCANSHDGFIRIIEGDLCTCEDIRRSCLGVVSEDMRGDEMADEVDLKPTSRDHENTTAAD